VAKLADYVGATFGSFAIDKYLESGKEADVFACSDRRTGLAYVLRLDSADQAVWAGPPLLPPRNASIERANAKGSWLFSSGLWQSNVEGRRSDPEFVIMVAPDLYGVVDSRYLVPVSSPVRVRDVPDVDAVIERVPPATVCQSLVWHELSQAIAAQLEPPLTLADDVLESALGRVGCPSLAESATPWLLFADIVPDWHDRAQRLLAGAEGNPGLEENLMLRLVCGIGKGFFTVEEMKACFRCRHFRANISAEEVHQLLAVRNLVSTIIGFSTTSVLEWMTSQLQIEPASEIADATEFELRENQRDLDRFELFLQTPAGETQQPITIATSDEGYQLTASRVQF
jgi:hypothetical protein